MPIPTGASGSSPPNGVVVSLSDIYQLMLALQNKQSEMDGKMGAFITALNTANEILSREIKRVYDEHKDDHNDHEERIRDLERRPVIQPKAVWASIAILIPLVSAIVAIIALATR